MSVVSLQFLVSQRSRIWGVGVVFVLVGILVGLVLPVAFTPREPQNAVRVEGTVVGFEDTGDSPHPVFAYTSPRGTPEEYTSPIGSNRTFYTLGKKAVLVVDPADPEAVFVEDDRDLAVAMMLLRILGGVFSVLGAVMLIMAMQGRETRLIGRVAGLIGALGFGATILVYLWYTRGV